MTRWHDETEPVSLGICSGLKETPDALLVRACRGNDALDHFEGKQTWIPKSVLAPENEVEEFERGECYVARWWAESNGIEE